MKHQVMLSEGELVKLIETPGLVVNVKFGPRGCWLEWVSGEPLPRDVDALARLRGVYAENVDGAGI